MGLNFQKIFSGLSLGPQASDPSGALAGDTYYNSAYDVLRMYNGTAWSNIPNTSYQTVATSGGTVTLTASSPNQLYLTGTANETVILPVVSTLQIGMSYIVTNLSTGTATVESSGANILQAMATKTQLIATCIVITGTGTASWNWSYSSVQASLPGGSPTGEVTMFAGSSAPSGYVMCDGTSYATAAQASLFAIIGYTYGGSGANFNVPDLRGIFVRGAGTNGTLANANGTHFSGTLGAAQNDKMQGHEHGISDPSHNHGISDPGHTHTWTNTNGGQGLEGSGPYEPVTGGASNYAPVTGANSSSGTGIAVNGATTGITVTTPSADGTNGTPRTGTETNPANLSLNYIIKT